MQHRLVVRSTETDAFLFEARKGISLEELTKLRIELNSLLVNLDMHTTCVTNCYASIEEIAEV